MRYRLPDGCDGVTLDGVTLDKAADGTVEAEPKAAADLAPHGIVPVEEIEPSADGRVRDRADKT